MIKTNRWKFWKGKKKKEEEEERVKKKKTNASKAKHWLYMCLYFLLQLIILCAHDFVHSCSIFKNKKVGLAFTAQSWAIDCITNYLLLVSKWIFSIFYFSIPFLLNEGALYNSTFFTCNSSKSSNFCTCKSDPFATHRHKTHAFARTKFIALHPNPPLDIWYLTTS